MKTLILILLFAVSGMAQNYFEQTNNSQDTVKLYFLHPIYEQYGYSYEEPSAKNLVLLYPYETIRLEMDSDYECSLDKWSKSVYIRIKLKKRHIY